MSSFPIDTVLHKPEVLSQTRALISVITTFAGGVEFCNNFLDRLAQSFENAAELSLWGSLIQSLLQVLPA